MAGQGYRKMALDALNGAYDDETGSLLPYRRWPYIPDHFAYSGVPAAVSIKEVGIPGFFSADGPASASS